MIFVTSDHGGFAAKEKLVAWLEQLDVPVQDLGPRRRQPQDDYPLWAAKLARSIKRHPGSQGIAVCRSGVGMALAANKFTGVRAVQGLSPHIARRSRLEENTNVLSLASDLQTLAEQKKIVSTWLKTTYKPVKRYVRRLREINRIEHGR